MFDRIIVSADDGDFLDYWPIVATAWKKFYSDKKISLAFVTNRSQEDNLVKQVRQYGDVILFKPVDDIPIANQGKVARHILSCEYENEICMIEDIDTIPMQKEFVENLIKQKEPNKLMVVGCEVYVNTPHEGKFPISNITAESYIFKQIVNPKNLKYDQLITSWCDMRVFDDKENIKNEASNFSDESLLRALISKWEHKSRITKVKRNVDIHKYWIDRSWWYIDKDFMNSNGYVTCNFLRPLKYNFVHIKPIIDYIYGRNVDESEIKLKR